MKKSECIEFINKYQDYYVERWKDNLGDEKRVVANILKYIQFDTRDIVEWKVNLELIQECHQALGLDWEEDDSWRDRLRALYTLQGDKIIVKLSNLHTFSSPMDAVINGYVLQALSETIHRGWFNRLIAKLDAK
jgi:hypothetical protein